MASKLTRFPRSRGGKLVLRMLVLPGRPEGLSFPVRATEWAAGIDLVSAESKDLNPGAWAAIGTGIAMEIPEGYEGQIRPRSGLAAKHGVTVLNSPATIDADYRGEVQVLLINHSTWSYRVEAGDRIAQLVIAPVEVVEIEFVQELRETARGARGFGHTGR